MLLLGAWRLVLVFGILSLRNNVVESISSFQSLSLLATTLPSLTRAWNEWLYKTLYSEDPILADNKKVTWDPIWVSELYVGTQ